MLENFTLWFLVVTFAVISVFQLSLALGASIGKFAFGGESLGKISRKYRRINFFGAFVAVALAGHYLAEIGVFESLLDQQGRSIVNWSLFVLLLLATVTSYLPQFKSERSLWGPMTLTMAASALIVAL